MPVGAYRGDMQDTGLDHTIHHLLGGTPPRVWSLLVTMFGDLAIAPEARMSGTTIAALTATIGIKPEATRVALHRLRKEGWIDSHRLGRQSRYGLTNTGRDTTNAAWHRVYGPSPADAPLFLVTEDPMAQADAAPAPRGSTMVQIAPRLFVSDQSTWLPTHWAVPLDPSRPVPKWVADKLCPTDLQTASQALHRRLAYVQADTGLEGAPLLHATALRVLIVHEWRRLILRVPPFPEELFAQGWHGEACRNAVSDLLARLPAPDLADLDTAIDTE
ncbi:MAG: PaaX family transcriptional regulator C-terminal domain-containing protein [Marivita sp.]|uniref:PaaX family transcriptional regulator C-terminal domain-containing protein n=1 Tax=Marivita sp. TaxID=2003365 RepID=UPI003EF23DCC